MRIVVTGGAGFLGSHLCERLIDERHDVACYDTLLTGRMANLTSVEQHANFRFHQFDVTNHLAVDGDVDWVMHLASPASPVDYYRHPIHTMKLGALGTLNCLGLAKAKGAGFFLASTSEVYGDPLVNPQHEDYWGNVNPIGPRGVYDEAKRFAEAMAFAYHRTWGIPIRIARIFNTHGPRMRRSDGRAVPTFIDQAMAGGPLTVHGDGTQTRSLCYVSDLIDGFMKLLSYDGPAQPVNLGNDTEVAVIDIARMIAELAGSNSSVEFVERPQDDPQNRRPDLGRAQQVLGWAPQIDLRDGLARTVRWCKESWR